MNSKFVFFSSLLRLGKDRLACSLRPLARLLRDEEGSILLYVTLALPAFIGFSALATEGALIFYNHRTLQSAADSAAYSAAVAYSNDPSADITTQAKAIFASYGFEIDTTGNNPVNQVNVPTPTITANYAGSTNTAITVTATRPQTRFFSGLWIKNAQPNSVSAIAIVSGGSGPGNCALALGKRKVGVVTTTDAPAAIEIKGGGGVVNINMPGCGVFSNSTSGAPTCDPTDKDASIHLQGSFSFYAGSVGTAGCVGFTGDASQIGDPPLPNTTQNFTQNDGAVADPYADKAIPTPGSPPAPCIDPTYPDKNTAPKDPVTGLTLMTLNPGRYCSLDTSNGGGKYAVTLTPGVFVFDSQSSGQPTVQVKNGSLTGTGVTLEFTSSSTPPKYPTTMLDVNANGAMSLTAPTSAGPTQGFVIMGDRTMPLGTLFDTHSNPNTQLSGTVYLPNGALDFQGNPVTGSTMCLQIIANTIQLEGNSSLTNIGCQNLAGGQKPIGSVVTLVR